MIRFLFILLIFLPTFVFGQYNKKPEELGTWCKKNIAGWSLILVAGVTNGLTEVLRHDYASFEKTFPGANDDFWNPAISWKNKYKNRNPQQGPAFFGSTTLFVSATDGYHLTRSIHNACVMGAITIKFCDKKRKWYWYAADFASYSLAYSVGFNLVYEGIRK